MSFMKHIEKNIDLSKKLHAYLIGNLSHEDERVVKVILSEDKELKDWLEQFRQKSYLEKRIQDHQCIDLDQKWKTHLKNKKKTNPQRVLIRKIWWAASVIVLLGTSLLMYQNTKHTIYKTPATSSINPGSTQAELIIENGSRYKLSGLKPREINEEGLLIQHNKQGLIYKNKPLQENTAPLMHTIVVPQGGKHHVILADGTKVHLNSQSRLCFLAWFKGKERRVELSGEAYFEVAHDKNKPFIVETPKLAIQVLGTQFNLKSYADEKKIVTTLVNGQVKLHMRHKIGNSIVLSPGQQAVLENNDVSVFDVDTHQFTAWKDGVFVFKDESLQDIFKRLSRWYKFEVSFANDSLKKLPFTGSVQHQDNINLILNLLEQTHHVKFEINENKILVR